MTTKAKDCALLLLIDPNARSIALARREDGLSVPISTIEPGDGVASGDTPFISKARLGVDPQHAAAFQDAALRAGFDAFGQLIARPATADDVLPQTGEWGRIARHRLAPDRRALTYLGRLLDPVDQGIRRHARVFTASLAHVSNSLKRRGAAERLVWMTPENAIAKLNDAALEPFVIAAPGALGGRPRPIKVSFRAGQRLQSRL